MKNLFLVLLIFTPIFIFAQDDDEWLDPKLPSQPRTNEGDDTNEYPVFIQDSYVPGQFYHSESYNFCQNIMRTIENLEKKDDRIIRVTIKGFADGLVKEELIDPRELSPYCMKYQDFSKGKEDVQLATVRACQIESILRELLKSKSYSIYVNFENKIYDIPDGGADGPELRKVEVRITYLKRKSNARGKIITY